MILRQKFIFPTLHVHRRCRKFQGSGAYYGVVDGCDEGLGCGCGALGVKTLCCVADLLCSRKRGTRCGELLAIFKNVIFGLKRRVF